MIMTQQIQRGQPPALPYPPRGTEWQLAHNTLGALPHAWRRAGSTAAHYQIVKGRLGLGLLVSEAGQIRTYLARRITIGDATGDLSAVQATVGAGDTYLNAGEFDNAVEAYKAAGNAANVAVGRSGLSAPSIFGLNTQLNALNSTPFNNVAATNQDAQTAQGLAQQILSALQSAASAAGGSTPSGGSSGSSSPTPVVGAAADLITYLTANGCTTSPIPQAGAFQSAWNATGGTPLSVDSKYGPGTEAALQAVMTASGSGTAPKNCFGQTRPTVPTVPPSVSSSLTQSSMTGNFLDSMPLWAKVVAGAALVGGVALAYKNEQGRIHGHARKVGGHARRLTGKLKAHAAKIHSRLRRR